MSKLNIACLLSPMADTEGPMEIVDGKCLTGPKKIMGKYGEVGLEASITFGEENPNEVHLDLVTAGKAAEVKSLQQSAIAMLQPKKFPGTLGVHALETEDIDQRDAFAVADMLSGLIQGLENQPDMVFTGRESMDYGHGVVGPALAQKLGLPYYSNVNEVKLNEGSKSVTATFIEGNDKLVFEITLPAVFGTTDWLNGKDSARFTSLKGVMSAKKFKRDTSSASGDANNKTTITSVEPLKSERRNQKLEGDEGPAMAKAAFDILVNQDKALVMGGTGADSAGSETSDVAWADGAVSLAGDVVLLADHDGTSVRLSSKQVLSQARKAADALGTKVTLLVLADAAGNLGSGCGDQGADRVVVVEGEAFKHPTPESVTAELTAMFGDSAPACLMTVASDLGRDVASYMASFFAGGLLQDVVELAIDGGRFSGKRVVSNARFVTNETITENGKCPVVSVRATAFDPIDAGLSATYHKQPQTENALKARLLEVVGGEQVQGIPLNEAKIIVSGGRGMKDAANFKSLNELASLLGGTVGASRAVTDLEWLPHDKQIGQTGTTVAPDVYIAVGISGAIQHLTGMLGSKYIVAINPDADAPIHKHADLSIIDKWENILPGLIEQVRSAS